MTMVRFFFACGFAALLAGGCVTNELGNIEATRLGNMSEGEAPRGWFSAAIDERCGAGGATILGDATLLRLPYLQQVSDESASLLWTAGDAREPRVVVSDADGNIVDDVAAAVDRTAPLASGNQYVARVSALAPHTVYCYDIVDSDGESLWRSGFRTAPRTGDDDAVSFAVLGDVGQATDDQYSVLSQMLERPYDLGLVTGDIAYSSGTLSSFENNYFAVYADLLDTIPFYPASGNHDYKTADAGPFRQVFSLPENGGEQGRELWYSFDWGNIHFVALDSEKVGPVQAAWLEADLAATELPWKIVFAHKPPYSSGYHGNSAGMQQYFVPLFERYGVQLALFGHDHNYERTVPMSDVTYVVTGGGGVGTRPVGASSFTAFSLAVEHFVYARVEGDHLTLWAIDATGNTFDTAAIEL